MFVANIVPGQGFQPFVVYEKGSETTSTGRAITAGYSKTDLTFFGILTNASQKEIEQWKQNGHPITHKIVEYSAQKKAKATDYLKCGNGRWFYVRGIKNHGDLNVSVSYYVEERADLSVNEKGADNDG